MTLLFPVGVARATCTGVITCRSCKKEQAPECFYRPGKDNLCKGCHREEVKLRRKSNREKHNRLRSLSRARRPWQVRYLNDVVRWTRERCKNRDIAWSISRPFVKDLWEKQGGRCALSGIEFRPTGVKGRATTFSPSLDRIAPELGYVEGNVRFILHGLNSLKGSGSDEDLFSICGAVMEKRNGS